MGLAECSMNKSMVLRYVVPFYVDAQQEHKDREFAENTQYTKLCRILDGRQRWKDELPGRDERDVYEYILQSVQNTDDEANIGRSWNYDFENKRQLIRYAETKPKTADTENECTYRYGEIKKAGLYLFRTNVGFFWYEIMPTKAEKQLMNVEEFIDFQNQFKELYRTSRKCVLERRNEQGEFEEFIVGKWVSSLLKELSGDIHYLGRRWAGKSSVSAGQEIELTEVPDKALIFNYIPLECVGEMEGNCKQELYKIAYLLSHGYNKRYHMSNGIEEMMVEPFDGVCWCASKDGVGYYTMLTSDNRHYFEGGLTKKICGDYFLLYILALHQSYSLTNYIRRVSEELPANPEQYFCFSSVGEKLDRLVAELNTFLMKSMYLSVSHIGHQNRFFEYLQKCFRTKEDVAGLEMGMNALVKLQRVRREKEEEKEEKRLQEQKEAEIEKEAEHDRQLNFSLSVLSVFAVFSALTDGATAVDLFRQAFSSYKNIFAAETWYAIGQHILENAPWSVILILCNVVIISLSVYCVITLVKNMIYNRKRKKAGKK